MAGGILMMDVESLRTVYHPEISQCHYMMTGSSAQRQDTLYADPVAVAA